MARTEQALHVLARIKVSPDPVRILVFGGGSSCVVASRWSRRLTFLELHQQTSPNDLEVKTIQVLDLPFCPRELISSRDGSKLVVADAFGGKLALIDSRKRLLESVRSSPAHNIRGLALSVDGRDLVLAHERLNPLARSTFDDIHWGLLIGSELRMLPLASVLDPNADLLRGTRHFELGDVGHGAGDPSGLVVGQGGSMIVALAGVDEIAVALDPRQAPQRAVVGRRPIALSVSPHGKLVYVANSLDDTVSIVHLDGFDRPETISLGPRPEQSLIDIGERLFFDARLSHDGWMSCHSCHTDGHTSGLLSDTLGDGSYGAPKTIPSLLGVGSTGPWTWTGSISRFEDQLRNSIQTTMHGPKPAPTRDQMQALAAYLRSLGPLPPSLAVGPRCEEAIARGREVFQAQKCNTCHAPPDFTAPERFDVGIADEVGNHLFNPPSLRGVGRREPLLHDGRASTLEELFHRHRHPRGTLMTPQEIDEIVAFLRSL
jgi:cytochrome c peroxidase